MATDKHGGDAPIEKGSSTTYPALGCPHCPAAFFKTESHVSHIDEQHPDQPSARAWKDGAHQITYFPHMDKAFPHAWTLSDLKTNTALSHLVLDHDGSVLSIETHPNHLREGLATKLWNSAKELSNSKKGMPAPKHSPSRTSSGDAFFKTVGGELPKRSPVSSAQFRGFRWGE